MAESPAYHCSVDFLRTPNAGGIRPHCPDVFEVFRADAEAVWAVIPKCSWSGCTRVGTRWIARHVANCDEHGSPFMLDTPWAELARKEGR